MLKTALSPLLSTTYHELPPLLVAELPASLERVRVPLFIVTVPLLTKAPFPWLTLSIVPLPVIVKFPLFVTVWEPDLFVSVLSCKSRVMVEPSGMVTLSLTSVSKTTVLPSAALMAACSVSYS